MGNRPASDEHYVLNLCDRALGHKSLRQHRFDFLRGDPGKRGIGHRLPVDAYYPELELVVEYRERQHSESVKLFNHPHTVSNCSRDEQRALYDQRRRDLLPKHDIALVEFYFHRFRHKGNRRLVRDEAADIDVIRAHLHQSLGTFRNGHTIAPKRGPITTVEEVKRRQLEVWNAREARGELLHQQVIDAFVRWREWFKDGGFSPPTIFQFVEDGHSKTFLAVDRERRAKGTAKMLKKRRSKKGKIDHRNSLIRAAWAAEKTAKQISKDRAIFPKAATTVRAQQNREKLIYRVKSSTSLS